MHVLLDTNIYLADITFGKPEHEALRNYLQTSNSNIIMPHIVKSEVEKNIKAKAQSEISKLSQLYSVSLGLIADIPEIERLEENIKERFERGLRRNRVTNAGYGDLGLETVIERSLTETPPFKSKGRGFRDALIWYSLLEYLRSNPEEHIAFITDNTQDFGIGTLKPELIAELTALGFLERVTYFQSLNDFLSEYSEPIAFITEEFIISNTEGDLEAYAESVDEDDLSIDYPSREVDWSVAELIHEESIIENFYIYRTTEQHYYVYVEASLNFYVGLEGYAYEWGFNSIRGDWAHDFRQVSDHTTAHKTYEFELKIDKSTHESELIEL